MSRVSKMSLNDIIQETNLIMKDTDIIFVCNNFEVINQFMENYKKDKNNNREYIKKFLMDNEEYIDKEKFLLLLVNNYKENIEILKEHIAKSSEEISEFNFEERFNKATSLRLQLHQQQENLEKAIRLGKGIEAFLTYYYYDEEEKRYRVKVVDSREVIDGKKINNAKALKRFNNIDDNFKNDSPEEELGIEFILQSILLTDLYNIFPNEAFGNDIRTMILENEILKNKLKTRDELEDLKTMESYEEYIGLIDSVSFDTIVPDIKNTLKEYVQYIDMDKLLLISAYRFYELLHEEDLEKELHEGIKDILEEILNNIKSNNASICCRLQSKKDNSYELQEITYSVNDIKKCISQFAGKVYLSSEEIEEYREKINNKEINLLQIDSEYIDVIFSKRELEELSKLSPENLLYVFNEYKWDISKIIELYENQAISIEHIRKIKEYIDLSESVNFEKLSLYYNQLDSNKEAIEKYEIYLMLYKEIFINDTNAEEITQNSNIVMEKIAEMYEGEEYHKAVKHYYKQGLITIDVIAEWNNESFIMELFNENIITIDVISKLVNDNKFPVIYLNQIYDNLLTNKDMEYNERISLIKKGFTNESVIFDLYKKNLIFEEDLRKLAEEGFVRKQEMQNLINSRTLSELEKNSAIVLTGLNSLTKKNNDIYYDKSEGTYGHKNTKSTGKFIIDPNERERFIRLLKAYKANTDLNEDSPFYNYDFYVIPDESGTIGLNSVVIAERYYEDKYSQTKFATNNATYFFKYKDLMVLSNLRKSEMTKERQDIVFTANHVIANEKREGNWAKSVISSIVKTMISSDLKEYSRENQKIIIMKKLSEIYTPQEMKEILEMATQIDFGEYRGEIEAPIERRAKNNSAPKGDDISDTAETR